MAFTDYTFAASGAPTLRTLPQRLSEIVNVKDWGAIGDGIANDSAAINSAINHIYTRPFKGAILYFPSGTYYLGNPATPIDIAPIDNIVCNLIMMGAGRDATIIRGTYSNGNPYIGWYDFGAGGFGYFLPPSSLITSSHRSDGNNRRQNANLIFTLCDMTIQNDSTAKWSLAVCIGPASNWRIENCKFIGTSGFAVSTSFNMIMRSCVAVSNVAIPTADNAKPDPLTALEIYHWPPPTDGLWDLIANPTREAPVYSGTFGIAFGQGLITNCKADGFDIGIAIAGNGMSVFSNRVSRCGIGFHHGLTVNQGIRGGLGKAISNSVDRCLFGHYPMSGFELKANIVSGTQGPADPAAVQGIVFSGGTATVTTVNNHNLPAGASKLVLMTDPAGWTPGNTGNEIVTCNNTGAKQFTYSLGAGPGTFNSASWNYPIQLCFDSIGATQRTHGANILSAVCSIASFRYGGTSEYDNIFMATQGPYGWSSQATVEYASWQFHHCGTTGVSPNPSAPLNPLAPVMRYIELPPIATAQERAEGQQYWIVDGPNGIGFGQHLTTGGGTNKYLVRYNGTNWTRVA